MRVLYLDACDASKRAHVIENAAALRVAPLGEKELRALFEEG